MCCIDLEIKTGINGPFWKLSAIIVKGKCKMQNATLIL